MSGDLATKACSSCKEILPLSAFGPDKSTKTGLRSYCNPCRKEKARIKSGYYQRQEVIRTRTEKECSSCKETKDLALFYKSARGVDGRSSICSQCVKEDSYKRRQKNLTRDDIPYPDNKICTTCMIVKTREQFGTDHSVTSGLRRQCKDCERERYHKDGLGFAKFGLTEKDYELLLEQQNGVCAICKEPPQEGKRLHVDHDHSCCPGRRKTCGNCNRGLLCFNCNSGIGSLRDDYNIVFEAASYLLSYKEKN